MKRKKWSLSDDDKLIQNYHTSTIKELIQKFDGSRSANSINAEIKRLRKRGLIKGYKDESTIDRSRKQRKE